MRNLLLFVALLSMSSTVMADDRASRFLKIMEASLNTTTLFYSRISPEIAEKIKQVTMPPEAKGIAQCVVDKSKSNGLLAHYDESLELSERFIQHIRDTPELTVFTLEQDAKFMAMQETMLAPKFEAFQAINKECGVLEMNMKLSSETGVYEALKLIPRD